MKFQEMNEAILDAETTMRMADVTAKKIGRLLVGRLRECPYHVLEALKKELKDYNMKTYTWKD